MTKSTKLETIVSIFNKKDLPGDWLLKSIGEICLPVQKVNPKENPDNEFNYIDISGIDNEKFRIARTKKYSGKEAPSRARQLVKSGDIVFSTVRTYLKNIAIVPPKYHGQIASTGFCVLRPVLPKYGSYLYYYLQYELFLNELAKFQRGTSYPAVRNSDVFDQFIPVPPENESACIVAEIEKQFSRLDEAVDNLKRVKANLKRYKASVLKAAVEGKLTEEWRKRHPDVEPADKLLERILVERRKKWEEAEFAKIKKAGKKPKDEKWEKKYKEPSQADISTLDELPNGWHWLTSDQLFWFVTSGSRGWAKYYSDSGAVFLRIGNLDHDSVSLDLKKVQFVKPPRGAEGTRTRVEENDILISITADVGMIGAIPRGFDEAYINQHISLARPVSRVNSLYIAWYLTSRLGQNQFIALQRGATKAGLGLDDIRSVNIPMPPFEEQAEIIFQIEKRMSVVGGIGLEVDKNLKRADRLRKSILEKAFSGRLVPQDPNDEPAEKLMERIKAEREKYEEALSKKRKKPMTSKEKTKEKLDIVKVLKEADNPMKPEDLFRIAGYRPEEVEGFYADLKKADQQKTIYQVKKKNGDVFLRTVR